MKTFKEFTNKDQLSEGKGTKLIDGQVQYIDRLLKSFKPGKLIDRRATEVIGKGGSDDVKKIYKALEDVMGLVEELHIEMSMGEE